MTITFNQAFGGSGGGASVVGGWSRPIFSSSTITFSAAGDVVISLVGAGGSGALSSGAATGANSAPWGRKKIKVAKDDVMVINIGAGGAAPTVLGTNGNAGNTTTVVLNGVTILTAQGSEPGVQINAAGTASTSSPAATITGADFWVPGIKAGTALFVGQPTMSGGAAPDLLQTGLGRSPNVTSSGEGVGGSLGTDAGGIPQPWIVLAEWGVVVTDTATASSSVGAPGRGGNPMGGILAGMFGGGGGGAIGVVTQGGVGAGGGASNSVAQIRKGGDAYAHMFFVPSE